ncbi:beta-1,3-galactosyl-O-glycosyl-glycoprotein beta-1,6-N-acetylglucosaminyltransferase 4-like [Boleophthalmus pectinirostris]|uniref:beta-1,3-galactosyl-O-glycosyl-glycoprotein beta-1,6-N-acetylglucosaminyltransferase 4-like n=1 Tax=Boleophthalmus pectinirostris TaxID=150288 RepID=UPI00242FE258|nr:beta-1,3-galactosyl-O-glycosyl-glycoprotein beta-1,6-N-acetylglucosaminyltransferase 4-like [Boleophthalmus pectinirostris]
MTGPLTAFIFLSTLSQMEQTHRAVFSPSSASVVPGRSVSLQCSLQPEKSQIQCPQQQQIRVWRGALSWLLAALALSLVLMVILRNSNMDHFTTTPAPLDLQTFHRFNVDCSAIYDMDPMEVWRALTLRKHIVEESDDGLVNLTSNCNVFLKSRGYNDVCLSQEEKTFPLAYSLVVHKYAWMVERLIKALYSPNNIFCIHYDEKSSDKFRSAMESLARCLPNVMIASKREYVVYASITRLKADLHCMSDLLKSEVKWKYIINLCGQDFPLRPNTELVNELTKLKGANMLETCRPTPYKSERYKYHHEIKDVNHEYKQLPIKTDREKKPPPHGIEMFTGSAYFVLSREFVEYMQSSDVVKDFLAWCEDTYSPDEHFWATLARLPGVPGEVPRSHPDVTAEMSKTRLVKWSKLEGHLYPRCTGVHIRGICIYGVAEIRWLLDDGHWFANKFDPKIDPVIIQCLEENLQKRQKLLQSLASSVCY